MAHYLEVTIQKADYSEITGKLVKISKQEILLDFAKGIEGIETNMWLTVVDKNGVEHRGMLKRS
jgi:hypothetical protein